MGFCTPPVDPFPFSVTLTTADAFLTPSLNFPPHDSHMPGWTGYVGPSLQLPIPAATNMAELLQQLFEPPPRSSPEAPVGKTRRGGSGSAKRSKSKSKDSKKKRRAKGN